MGRKPAVWIGTCLTTKATAACKILVRDLNHSYTAIPALHARDCEPEGFEWMNADDFENSVFAWARHDGEGGPILVVVCNFTPVPRDNYQMPLPKAGTGKKS